MDFLKLTKRLSLLLFLFLLVTLINAQSEKPVTSSVISAFKDSYTAENSADYEKAISSLTSVYDESSYELNLRLGWLNYSSKKYSEALSYYEKCIKLMPLSIEAKFGYANSAAGLEKWEDVNKQYDDILTIDPNNSSANYKRGLNYYYAKDYSSAYKYFEKVVKMYPFDYYSVLMFAWTNYQLGKSREAEVLFNKVFLISPDDASAKEGLSLINK
jgi:tetratricopeptide (TPR) repeat protein